MKMRRAIPAFRDGYVSFVRPLESNISSFGAKKNTRTTEDVCQVVDLAYDEKTKRQQDLEFAYSADKTLDMKICCPYHPDVNTKLQAIIENTLYDVYMVDPDKNNMQMFVYMQENRKLKTIDQVELVGVSGETTFRLIAVVEGATGETV